MDKQITMEIHCLCWSSNGKIPDNGCYTNLGRAEKHKVYANKHLRWLHRLCGDRWNVRTLTVKMRKKQKR